MHRTFALFAVLVVASGCLALEAQSPLLPRGLAYLVGVQNDDGGYAAAGTGPSDFSTSAWVALAFGAADPTHESVPALRAYLANQSDAVRENTTGSFSRANAVSLYVLSSLAIDVPGRHEHLMRLRSYLDNTTLAINERLFLLGALGNAGATESAAPLVKSIREKLLDPSDADLTKDAWVRSHAILALLANNESSNDPDLRAAARSLLPFQKEDAGFRSSAEYEPDASTTAAAVAVLSQIRFVYSHEHETGLEFILSLQGPTGSVRFSEEFDFSPVKTTSEAILAATGDGPFRN
ncbi:MAG TPA: prenyltransferase/squalene oxidase repeat-containing protein [Candidatus Thermoplasmatota archaeon]